MGPYPDFHAVLWGVVANAVMLLSLVLLRAKFSGGLFVRANYTPDHHWTAISPSMAWMVWRRAYNSDPAGEHGSLHLAIARMERERYLSVDKTHVGVLLRRTDKAGKRPHLFAEEKAFAEALFKNGGAVPVNRKHRHVFRNAQTAYDTTLREQCVGPLYNHSLMWMWIATVYAFIACITYGRTLAITTESGYMGIAAAVLTIPTVMPWLLGQHVSPQRIAGAFITLSGLTAVHAALAYTFGEGSNLFDPIFVTCLWLTGLALISWEWLKVYTADGKEIEGRLAEEKRLLAQGIKPGESRPPVVDWGGAGMRAKSPQAKSVSGSINSTEEKHFFPDWEGALHGTIMGLKHIGSPSISPGSFWETDLGQAIDSVTVSGSDDGDGGDGGGDGGGD